MISKIYKCKSDIFQVPLRNAKTRQDIFIFEIYFRVTWYLYDF